MRHGVQEKGFPFHLFSCVRDHRSMRKDRREALFFCGASSRALRADGDGPMECVIHRNTGSPDLPKTMGGKGGFCSGSKPPEA